MVKVFRSVSTQLDFLLDRADEIENLKRSERNSVSLCDSVLFHAYMRHLKSSLWESARVKLPSPFPPTHSASSDLPEDGPDTVAWSSANAVWMDKQLSYVYSQKVLKLLTTERFPSPSIP